MNQNVIYYLSGCYGTFIEWILSNAAGALPFTDSGNSHLFVGNKLHSLRVKRYFESSEQPHKFIRMHPGIYVTQDNIETYRNRGHLTIVSDDLAYLNKHQAKTLVLYSSPKSIAWREHNRFKKIHITDEIYETAYKPLGFEKSEFAWALETDVTKKFNLLIQDLSKDNDWEMYGKQSVHELDTWELRELVSNKLFTMSDDFFNAVTTLRPSYPNTLFVDILELKNNFKYTILKIAEYFDVTISADLDFIEQEWRAGQHDIDKDSVCENIVNAVMHDEYLDWSDAQLELIDEARVQKLLADNNIHIKCFGLDKFPTNTKDFKQYLE